METHPHDCLVEGVVSSEPKIARSGSVSFTMVAERIESIEEHPNVITAPISFLVHWEGKVPSYGDRISFQGMPGLPPLPRNPGTFDYRSWLQRHGIYTQFTVDPAIPGTILSSDHGNPVMAWAISARHRMEAVLGTDLENSSPELSAIKGITLGVTENAPEGFTDEFRFTGTMHLFAVSGLHVGMLAVIIEDDPRQPKVIPFLQPEKTLLLRK